MELKEKVETFKDELLLIFDKNIRNFVIACMDEAPDYVWKDCPSSSSGNYHPIDELGHDGTIIHTKRVFAVAYDLARGLDVEDKRDVILAAALLHDLLKQGIEKKGYTVHEHPQLMANLITKVYNNKFRNLLSTDIATEIYWAVCLHYGPWSGKDVKKPLTEYSMVDLAVYIADYVSSKRFVHVDYKRRTD
jgi:HD superfamily phosphohydrolase YqeK